MPTALRGIGIVGGFGCGVEKLHRALISGLVTPKTIPFETKNRGVEMPVFRCDTSSLEVFIHKRALRRMDHYSRLALLGSYLALEDAGMLEHDLQHLAVVIATGYGATQTTFAFLNSILEGGDSCASPTLFSNSIHNAAAAHISSLLKARGPSLTVSQFEMSVPSAMITACQWLEERRVDAVLFGGVDEYCDVMGYSWQRFFGSDPTLIMQPLAWGRQSAIAGEGCAFFLLTRNEDQTSSYGSITDIQLGHIRKDEPVIAQDALLVLGADGHPSSAKHYARWMPEDIPAAVYTPLYGSFPAGCAFDLAIAALSIREGKIFATPLDPGGNSSVQIVRTAQSLDSRPISCLKFSCKGEFGLISLAGV